MTCNSLALSKIERGSEDDRADVLALLRSGRVTMDSLQKYFDEIIVRYGEQSLRQDQRAFAVILNRSRRHGSI